MKKRYKKEQVLDDQNRWFHQSFNYTENRPEASNTDDLCSLRVLDGKVDSKISNAVRELSSPLVQRKKRMKLSRGGNFVAQVSFCSLLCNVFYILLDERVNHPVSVLASFLKLWLVISRLSLVKQNSTNVLNFFWFVH